MNKDVREYLIEIARGDEPTIFYGELNTDNNLRIDLGSPEGQEQLKRLLIEISTYENQHGRPMLTAVAINKKDKDQGSGFYELAELFGYGKKSELRKKGWGKKEINRVREFWQNESNYLQFAKTGSSRHQTNKIARLFESLTISEEYQWAKDDWWDYYIDFVRDVKKLQAALAENPQLNIDHPKLYKTLSAPIQSFESFMAKWLKENRNGISSRGQSVLSNDNFKTIINDPAFKIISKVVINNPTAKTYQLLMDWWYGNEEISNRPLLINRALAACLPEKLSSTVDNGKFWFVVNILKQKYGFVLADEEWNWFTANSELTGWLDSQLKEVIGRVSDDVLEQQIWRNIFVWLIYDKYHGKEKIPSNTLIRRGPPEDGFTEMPESNTGFDGHDVDFERKAKVQKELGDAGEELVKIHEIKVLEGNGMPQQAKLVRIAKPGEGFDVYSFDENGNEKFIEVKTTAGNWRNRFYLTRHEIKFMDKNEPNYSLYRVYNFDEENNSGEFFEFNVDDIRSRFLMDPTQFEVVIGRK